MKPNKQLAMLSLNDYLNGQGKFPRKPASHSEISNPPSARTIDGNDTAGTLTITTGSDGMVAGELAKIAFSKQFGKTPRIILSAQDEQSSDARIFPSTKTLDDYTIKTANTLAPNTTYTFDYFIVE